MGLVADNPMGEIVILSTGFGTVPVIVDGGDAQRSVSVSTSLPFQRAQGFFFMPPNRPEFISILQISHSVIFTYMFVSPCQLSNTEAGSHCICLA